MARILYPVLTEPVLTAAQQPEQVTESRFHQPLSMPVLRGGLATAIVVASGLFFVEAAPFPEAVTADRWFQPLSTPTRRPYAPPGHIGFAQAAPFTETVTLGWFAPFGTPVRRPYAAPGHLAFTEAAPFGESVTADRWVEPLSVPTLRGGLSAAVMASAGGVWGTLTPPPPTPSTGDRFVGFIANTGRLMSSRF